MQEQIRAEEELAAAMGRREERRVAVARAEQAWQRALTSGMLDPDVTAAVGALLIERADALSISIDREGVTRHALAACEDARREADARLRQVQAVADLHRRKLRRQHDERMLTAIEDRTAYGWRRA